MLIALQPRLEQAFFRWFGENLSIFFANDWAGIRVVLTGFAITFAFLVVVAVHECGHLVIGLAMGFRFRWLHVWRWQVDRDFKVSRRERSESEGLGGTLFFPAEMRNRPYRDACMTLAGPLANLISGYAYLALPFHKYLASDSFIFLSFVLGLGSLVPFTGTDGKHLLTLLWNRPKHERGLALAQILEDRAPGVEIESLSPDLITAATGFVDESVTTVLAHLIAYAAAYNQHNDDEAERLLEVCLQRAGFAPPFLREVLITCAGVFQAGRRKRVDLAKAWLADLPATPTVPYHRLTIEGAILEAEENLVGALQRVDAIEAAIKERGGAELKQHQTLRGFAKWRADLEQKLKSADACSAPKA